MKLAKFNANQWISRGKGQCTEQVIAMLMSMSRAALSQGFVPSFAKRIAVSLFVTAATRSCQVSPIPALAPVSVLDVYFLFSEINHIDLISGHR